jgi:hypothetical protein
MKFKFISNQVNILLVSRNLDYDIQFLVMRINHTTLQTFFDNTLDAKIQLF